MFDELNSFDEEEFDEEEMFTYMIENGYIEIAGIDPDGDFVYKMTRKMGEHFPEVFEEHLAITNALVFDVWQKGLLEVVMNPNGTWTIQENEKTSIGLQYNSVVFNENFSFPYSVPEGSKLINID